MRLSLNFRAHSYFDSILLRLAFSTVALRTPPPERSWKEGPMEANCEQPRPAY